MKIQTMKKAFGIRGVLTVLAAAVLVSCATTITRETEYTSGGQVSYAKEDVNKKTVYELRRVFADTKIEGEGIFENENEGLARSTAMNIAINEMAKKVQSTVRSESAIYNQQDVREVIETRVNAIVSNCKIESAGYIPNTKKYMVRVSIEGEQLVREIEKRIVK
jgi:hypothetical protein